ncbi:MAG: hypothetical protein Q9209_000722 [Squamulea sp. 1 TL-2023]
MSSGRKYAGLIEDIDDAAPDIYETPELTDDTSTIPASSTLQSGSRASSTDGLDSNDAAIDRQRIDASEARNSFLTDDARENAFHGWIGSKRAAYRTSSRRGHDGSLEEGFVDTTDEEDEEGLERKLARLRREVAEVKESFQKRRNEAQAKKRVSTTQNGSVPLGLATLEPVKTLDSLSQVLDKIDQPEGTGQDTPTHRLFRRLDEGYSNNDINTSVETTQKVQDYDNRGDDSEQMPSNDQVQTLSKISDFDKRLRLLESALGMDLIPLPTQDRSASRAVLPTLDGLDRKISSISTTELSLDQISRQIKQMTEDAQKLTEARKAAAALLTSKQSSTERKRMSTTKSVGPAAEDSEDLDQTSKINALYGTLPTIESLSPLLPSVLDRLRSLRIIHADAANASDSLSKVESRQSIMAEELKKWREGLEKLDLAMQHGETTMKDNMGVVDGWVKELESRIHETNTVRPT